MRSPLIDLLHFHDILHRSITTYSARLTKKSRRGSETQVHLTLSQCTAQERPSVPPFRIWHQFYLLSSLLYSLAFYLPSLHISYFLDPLQRKQAWMKILLTMCPTYSLGIPWWSSMAWWSWTMKPRQITLRIFSLRIGRHAGIHTLYFIAYLAAHIHTYWRSLSLTL